MSKRLKPQLKKLETKNTNYKDHLIKSAPTISSVIEFDPTILISNSIIIGPEPSSASDVDKLRELGVKQILNTALECDDTLSLNNEFKYLKLNMIDNPSAINVQDFLNKGSDFIDDAKLHSRPIYVHCKAGKSRSVAIVIAHLIRANRWDINRAYDYVKQRRETASPNIGFIAELMLFQKDLEIFDYSDEHSNDSTNTPSGSPYANEPDNKLKASFDRLAGCRTPSSRPLSAGPGVLMTKKNKQQKQHGVEQRIDDEMQTRLHLQETLGNHSEVEKKDRSGRYIHPRRAPVDNRLQPLRRVSKAGLESATLDFLKEYDYESKTPTKETIEENPTTNDESTQIVNEQS
ncbi:phosphatases II [Wallemia mellicola]|nr:phosphatases II [Wallemia mellicola]TIC41138.1 phosphatases II [Wallemia mellicola]